MRRLVFGVVLAAIVGCAGWWGFGASRPADHVATVSRTVSAPPEAVWALISGLDDQESWRPDLVDVRRIGNRIEEHAVGGDVLVMEVDEERAPERLVTRIIEQSAFSGTWTFTLTPDGDGTRVEIVEQGRIPSPFVRALAAIFMDPNATGTSYLDALAAKCNMGL